VRRLFALCAVFSFAPASVLAQDKSETVLRAVHDCDRSDLKDPDRIIQACSLLLNVMPHPIRYFNRGSVYLLKGDDDRALTDFNEAIRLNPRFTEAYVSRAFSYHRKGEYDRALRDCDDAIRLGPINVSPYLYRGDVWEKAGDRAKAIEDYNKVLVLLARTEVEERMQARARRRLAELQTLPPPGPTAAAPSTARLSGRRVALVIGNARYKVEPLRNPGNDAAAVAEALEKVLKFDKVIARQDLSLEGFRTALREFSREVAGADLGVVYFAGHGTESGGRNYLIPVDAALAKASDLELEAVALDAVLAQLNGVRKLKLVILDACRNNIFPLAGATRKMSRGLSRIEPDENTLVIYAAKDGTTADDGVGRMHSPFTAALLKHIGTPSLELRFLFGKVRDDVLIATGRAQQPYVYGTLGGEPVFLRP
jgi:tetratricopeptide (TPR) repeat protein